MKTIAATIRDADYFLRRRGMLALGYSPAELRAALAERSIFRVRQGWFSVPDAPSDGVSAVRVGGRLTGRSALASYGVKVPHRRRLQVAVMRDARRLRSPGDKRVRLGDADALDVRWVDWSTRPQTSPWRVSPATALLEVLRTEGRDIAVACCDLAINSRVLTAAQVLCVFEEAPRRVRPWAEKVDGRSGAFGETYIRLWLGDEGIPFEPQVHRSRVGWLDGQISRWTFVEIDGAQHADQGWAPGAVGTDDSLRQMERDHHRDAVLATNGERSLRFTYRLLLRDWGLCLAAMRQAIADDERREKLERAHAALQKRRRSAYARAKRRRKTTA